MPSWWGGFAVSSMRGRFRAGGRAGSGTGGLRTPAPQPGSAAVASPLRPRRTRPAASRSPSFTMLSPCSPQSHEVRAIEAFPHPIDPIDPPPPAQADLFDDQ